MKRLLPALCLSLLAACHCTDCKSDGACCTADPDCSSCAAHPGCPAPAPNELCKCEREDGWKLLFDGRSTAGWHNFGKHDHDGQTPVQGWTVEDGALVMTGGGGDLVTDGMYGSFELSLEWQVAPGGNSGIMYHVIDGPEYTFMSGPEMQVLDNTKHHDGGDPITSAGACYGLYVPCCDTTKPAGEWNRARLVVDHGKVEHWLNGVLLCQYELGSDDWNTRVANSKFKGWEPFGKAAEGRIALQDHGDRVAYRDIKLREL